jgi:hypothetical protein
MGPKVGLDECGKSWTPRPGSVAPARAQQLKIFILNWKNWLLVAQWLGLGPKGLLCAVDRYIVPRKTKNYVT